ncbi:MAG: hypothetical protein ACP5SI_04475 [Chloroflexia bacterium]
MDRGKGRVATLPPWAFLLGLGVLLEGGLVALLLLMYRFPELFDNVYGYFPGTRYFFARGWGIAPPASISSGAFSRAFGALWFALNGAWLGAFRLARRTRWKGRTLLAVVLGCGLVFEVTLVLGMPPLLSTDLYNYLAYGRMWADRGLNPYLLPPSQIGSDPVLAFPLWDIVTHYGPVWTALEAAVARLSASDGIFGALLLFKGCAAVGHLAIAWIGYLLAAQQDRNAAAGTLLLLGWSPLLLLEGAGNGHNDLAMMALAMAGLLSFRVRRPWAGYLLLLLSALVKYVTLLLLGFCLLAWLRLEESTGKRLRLLAALVGVGLILLAAAYAPFWQGPATVLAGLGEETTHLMLSPSAFLHLTLQRLWAHGTRIRPEAVVQGLQKGGLLLLLLWQGVRLWRRPGPSWEEATAAWNVTCFLYLILLHNAIFPWYFIWPYTTAATQTTRPAGRRVALLSGGLGSLAVLLYALPL